MTKALAASQVRSGGGCSASGATVTMSQTASTSTPTSRPATETTMITCRSVGSAGDSPRRAAMSTIGSTGRAG